MHLEISPTLYLFEGGRMSKSFQALVMGFVTLSGRFEGLNDCCIRMENNEKGKCNHNSSLGHNHPILRPFCASLRAAGRETRRQGIACDTLQWR